MNISTKSIKDLPSTENLKRISQSIAMLDAKTMQKKINNDSDSDDLDGSKLLLNILDGS